MILLSLVLFTVTVLVYLYQKTIKPSKFPPGPSWSPFTGTAPTIKSLAKKHGGVHKALHELSKTYNSGVIGLNYGGIPTICVHNDKLLKEILTRDEFQSRPTSFFSTLRSFGTNKGITFTNGDLWTVQRRFLLRQLRDVGFGKARMDIMIEDELQDIIATIGASNTPDLSRIFASSVLNVIWAFLAGERLDHGNTRLHGLLKLMERRTKSFDMTGGWLNLFPWIRYIAPEKSGYKLIMEINVEMKDLFAGIINEHVQTWHDGRNDDVIYAFLTEMNEYRDESFTNDQLVMLCVDLFFGGATTTSTSLDFAFLCMLLYPDVQKKVHKTIDAAYQHSALPQYKERHLIPYVEAVIYEVMRCYLATPITGPRIATKNTELENYNIPEGTTVLINNYSSNHDPKLWKDPEVFRPERFINENGKVVIPNYFYPFNIGRRKCPADTLARNCMFTFFAGVLQTYEIELHDKSKKLTGIEIPGITISPESYVCKFKKRH